MLLTTLAYLGIAALAGLMFVNAMNKGPSRDEQMYCTAGVLLSQGLAIYSDFSYVSQLPYHPVVCESPLLWSGGYSSSTGPATPQTLSPKNDTA
ncbi:MAG: hypothetical protein HQ515_22980 [Phycisphaeraceae bacterium]|nr:hypothetical protein [Phycisphaeraceae bacterium]